MRPRIAARAAHHTAYAASHVRAGAVPALRRAAAREAAAHRLPPHARQRVRGTDAIRLSRTDAIRPDGRLRCPVLASFLPMQQPAPTPALVLCNSRSRARLHQIT
eukprot:6200277-Pleurochrysis_carterae.AAC.1